MEHLTQKLIEQQIGLAELALANLRELLAATAPEAAPITDDTGCDHPEDKRINMSAMGITRWKCQACGFGYEKRI